MATSAASTKSRRSGTTGRQVLGVSAISAGALGIAASVAGFATTPSRVRNPAGSGARSGPSALSGPPPRDGSRPRSGSGKSGAGTSDSGNSPSGKSRSKRSGGDGEATSPSASREKTAPAPDDPRKPDDPTDLKKRSWTYILKKVVREFGADKCTDLAAALVYYSVLALFPGILAIVSLLGIFGQAEATEKVVFGLLGTGGGLTATLKPVIEGLTHAPAAPLALIIGILGALWSASGYVGAFSRAMNRVYGIDEGRPIWKLRPTQLAITTAVVILVVIGALILVLSGPVASTIGAAIGLGPTVVFVWGVVKWPVLAAIAVVVIAILYYFAPNVKQPKFRWTSTGSVLALVLWAVASTAFVFYVGNFANYNKTYGTLGGVIVFLLWLWITNIVLLFGAEWDAELERGRELQGGIAAEEDIQLPPRDSRLSEKKAAKHADDVAQGRRLRESRGERS